MFLLSLFVFAIVALFISGAVAAFLWQNRAFPWAKRIGNILVAIIFWLTVLIVNSLGN